MFCNVCFQGDKLFHASGLATELFFRYSVVLGPDRGQNGSNRACALLLASSLLLAMAGSRKLPAARTPMPGSHSSAGQSVRLITVRLRFKPAWDQAASLKVSCVHVLQRLFPGRQVVPCFWASYRAFFSIFCGSGPRSGPKRFK